MKANTTPEEVNYCLGNGATISYTYSPGSSVLKLIQNVVRQYVETGYTNQDPPDFIWVRPELQAGLRRELVMFGAVNESPFWGGNQIMRISCLYASVDVLVDPKLEFPVFYGTEEQKQDVMFSYLMEEHLNG